MGCSQQMAEIAIFIIKEALRHMLFNLRIIYYFISCMQKMLDTKNK